MIFQHTWQQVLEGTKTQIRQLVKSGEYWSVTGVTTHNKHAHKWQVGKDYAVQPGRGQKQAGRIRITAIRQEDVQDMSEDDAVAEGCIGGLDPDTYIYNEHPGDVVTPLDEYITLWNEIHTKPGTRWEDNPRVWVLEFELVQAAEVVA